MQGAGESALFVSKQFGRDQVAGDGGAVDAHKRAVRTVRVLVNSAGNQLFAGTSFARNQNRGVGVRNLGDARQYGLQTGRGADDLFEHRHSFDFLAQRQILLLRLLF